MPPTGTRPRVVATTDGEIDDRCSMVRFLLYANEWDIEGIVESPITGPQGNVEFLISASRG